MYVMPSPQIRLVTNFHSHLHMSCKSIRPMLHVTVIFTFLTANSAQLCGGGGCGSNWVFPPQLIGNQAAECSSY